MYQFVTWCRQSPRQSTVCLASAPTLPSDPDCLLTVDLCLDQETPVLQAHVLPVPWPLFGASKQDLAVAKNVYFHRLGKPHQGRCKETLRLLKEGRKVAWLGAPGIGKSAGMNFVLTECVRHLGDDGWPRQVALRVETDLTTFAYTADGTITVEVISVDKLEDLLGISKALKRNDGVLLVELGEEDRGMKLHCGAFFTVSNRDADEQFKELDKGGLYWLLDDPWSLEELTAAALCLLATGERHLGATLPEVTTTVKSRYAQVGGLPRFVLGGEDMFKKRCLQQVGVTPVSLFKDFSNNRIYSVTWGAKFFMAPTIQPDVAIPTLDNHHWSWQFLSRKRALAARMLAETMPLAVLALEQYGLLHQVEETMVSSALLGDSDLAPRYRLQHWEWYADGQSAKTVPPTGFHGRLQSLTTFDGRMYRGDVRTLADDVLYQSAGSQMMVGDCFFVSHSTKRVFMLQVSARPPSQHPFQVSNIIKIRDALRLSGEDVYHLVLVYVNDWSVRKQEHALVFADSGRRLSLKKVASLAGLVSAFLVRAPISPRSVKHELSSPFPLKLEPSTVVYVAVKKGSKGKYHLDDQCRFLAKKTKTVPSTVLEQQELKNRDLCAECGSRTNGGNGVSCDERTL